MSLAYVRVTDLLRAYTGPADFDAFVRWLSPMTLAERITSRLAVRALAAFREDA